MIGSRKTNGRPIYLLPPSLTHQWKRNKKWSGLLFFGQFIGDVVCIGHRGGAVLDEFGAIANGVIVETARLCNCSASLLTDYARLGH